MNRSLILLLITSLLAFFVYISDAILSIKILELKVQLTKSQIMNYEFSSEILKKKFRQMLDGTENYKSEIETSAMESSVLNFEGEEKKLQMTFNENMGLIIVNIIRKLSFKDFIYLMDDQTTLLKLQYAFLLERNQRYANASEKYTELERALLTGLKDDRAFVLLHNGYCIALTGDTPRAVSKLEELIDNYPGTHFSNSAQILIDILNESNRRTKKILNNTDSPENILTQLFHSGQYALVLKELTKKPDLNLMDRYMRARSNEKVGNIKLATPEYVELASQRTDLEVAKLANRRLLMLGNVYGGDKKTAEKAEKTAAALGDNVIAEEIKEGAKKQLSSVVIEKIKKNQENIPEELKEIKEEIKEELPSLAIPTPVPIPQEKIKKTPPKKIAKKVQKQKELQKISIRLADDRSLTGEKIEFTTTKVFITSGSIRTSIPVIMVNKIELKFAPETTKGQETLNIFVQSNKYTGVKEILISEGTVKFRANDGNDFSATLEDLKKITLSK